MRPQHHVGSAFDLLKCNFISPSRPPTFCHASLRKLRQTFRSSESRLFERTTGAILRKQPPIKVDRGYIRQGRGSWRVSAILYMGRLPGTPFYPPHTSRLAPCSITPCPSPHHTVHREWLGPPGSGWGLPFSRQSPRTYTVCSKGGGKVAMHARVHASSVETHGSCIIEARLALERPVWPLVSDDGTGRVLRVLLLHKAARRLLRGKSCGNLGGTETCRG